MIPKLNGIDHVHVYVTSWTEAEYWYKTVLGFERVEKLMSWAVGNGPLTLADPSGKVHLALFESEKTGNSTIAFGATGEEFLAWKTHLEKQSLTVRLADHDFTWSLYFSDPDDNLHEITTFDHACVSRELAES